MPLPNNGTFSLGKLLALMGSHLLFLHFFIFVACFSGQKSRSRCHVLIPVTKCFPLIVDAFDGIHGMPFSCCRFTAFISSCHLRATRFAEENQNSRMLLRLWKATMHICATHVVGIAHSHTAESYSQTFNAKARRPPLGSADDMAFFFLPHSNLFAPFAAASSFPDHVSKRVLPFG